MTDIFREAYFAYIPINVKLGHFRIECLIRSICENGLPLGVYSYINEIPPGGAYSPFSINQRSPSRHTEGEGEIKPHFSFYAP